MSKKVINIIIVDISEIIFEGISAILTNTGKLFSFHRADNLSELEHMNLSDRADIILVNYLLVQNQLKYFQSLKKEFIGTNWIGIVYSFTDPQLLSLFDEIININDPQTKIIASVQKLSGPAIVPGKQHPQQESLSERETDVLKLLVSGNANKEIADKLNISTHTVISHRKNISQKTGIKSLSGLTIYAVVKNIITIDSYNE
jgi:DNA-binding CsgD family transcriptional regulator